MDYRNSRPLKSSARAAAIGLLFLGAGCASVPLSPAEQAKLTPAERKLREDKARFDDTVVGGAVQGAVIGAVLGAAVGAVRGGGREALAGAAIGAAAGGGLGALDGYRTAKLQQAKMDQAGAINAVADDVRKDNQRLQQFVAQSSTVLAEASARLESLRADVAAKRVSAAEAEAARKREQTNLREMESALTKAKKTRDDYQKVANSFQGSPAQGAKLSGELKAMEQQIATLEGNIARYGSAITASRA